MCNDPILPNKPLKPAEVVDSIKVVLTPEADRGLARLASDIFDHVIPCVLIVDDNDDDVAVLSCAVESVDPSIMISRARGGAEAHNYIQGKGCYGERIRYPVPTVVILDLNLPDISGIEVLRQIRSERASRSAQVIALTGSDAHADAEAARMLGVTAYIQKPSTLDGFVGLVTDWRASGLI